MIGRSIDFADKMLKISSSMSNVDVTGGTKSLFAGWNMRVNNSNTML